MTITLDRSQVNKKLMNGVVQAIREATKAEDDQARAEHEDLLRELVDGLEHTFMGPTWQKTAEGKWDLPEHTLGWELAGWCAEYLNEADPDDPLNPLPWKFTREQLRFLLWWYAVDESGRFVYRKGVLQRLKGWGKDPLLAVICLIEFVGPCRFSHWERNGVRLGWDDVVKPGDVPVGKPVLNSLVQVAAVTQKQTTNTADMFPVLMSKKFIKTFNVTPGLEIIRARAGRQQIVLVTSSYRALEGNRSTFVVLNETQHWVKGNEGHKMYETVDGNVTKGGGKGARYLAITNAYLPGEDSVAERARLAYMRIQEGLAFDVGVLYDTIEANPLVPLHPIALDIVIPIIRGDAVWLDPFSILASMQDETIPLFRSRRMWLNQVTTDDDALHDEGDWDSYRAEEYLKPDDEIVLGFDGGKTDDATALVAIRVSDSTAFALGIWEKDGEGWIINRAVVRSKVAETFRNHKVVGFYADENLWESETTDWHESYGEDLLVKSSEAGNSVKWDMRRYVLATRAHERLMDTITQGKLRWSWANDMALGRTFRRHVLSAYRNETIHGLSFRKADETRKIDAYAALVLAHECLVDYRVRGKKPDTTTNRVWFRR